MKDILDCTKCKKRNRGFLFLFKYLLCTNGVYASDRVLPNSVLVATEATLKLISPTSTPYSLVLTWN